MTLEEINELVDEIQQLLMSESDPSEEELMDLAGRHEDLVRAAAKRLKAVDSLLSRGLRSEAIELAEREPNLNEVAIGLDFPELDAWNEMLARFQMQPIPALPADVAAELNDAYGTSAPLEKLLQRHRGAALARAPLSLRIDILRRLCVVDKANLVWAKDVKAFELQRLSDIKSELELAIREKNAATLTALHQELTSPNWRNPVPADLQRKVTDAHARIRQVSARTEMEEISHQLSNAYADFDIGTAKQLGQRFEALAQIVMLPPSDSLLNVAGPALDWIREEQTRDNREKRFQAQLIAIEEALNGKTTIEELERLYYGVTQHGQALPEPLANRLADRLETLRVDVARRRRSIIIATTTAAVVMLLAMGLFIWHTNNRNIISKRVSQFNILMPDAKKTGILQPLQAFFRLLEEEPKSISQAPELLGPKQQFETLKRTEKARVGQIEQLVAAAINRTKGLSRPSEFSEFFAQLTKAQSLAKNDAEKNNVLKAETEIRKQESAVQQRVDADFGIILKDVTADVAKLPGDSTAEYDAMLGRLSELEKTPEVSVHLLTTPAALRTKVLSQRADVAKRLAIAKDLQLITDSLGQMDAFVMQLQKYMATHAGTNRAANFKELLGAEKNLWTGALAWNDMRSKLLAVDLVSISPMAAKTLVDEYAAFLKSSGPYCGETLLGDRLLALQAVAKRKMGSDGTFTVQFLPVFDGKAITASFLIEADKDTPGKQQKYYADAAPQIEKKLMAFDYYTTPSGDQTLVKELSLSAVPNASDKNRNDWFSPQTRLYNTVSARLKTLTSADPTKTAESKPSADFEKTVSEIVTMILDEPDVDPILRLLLAEQVLAHGSEGSIYLKTSTETILQEIATAGIPRLFNWVDFRDKDAIKYRDVATAFLDGNRDKVKEALTMAAMNRDASKSSKIGPALRWVGWLSRNDKNFTWEIAKKADASFAGGTRLCVFQKSTPASPPSMVDVGTVNAQGTVDVLKLDGASAIEGRPIFQILDQE